MAGGSGERFWPVSQKMRPKQFLNLTDPDKSLLLEAAERAAGIFGWQNTTIATGLHIADRSRQECPLAHVLAEPAKRNTTGCLAWVAANIMAARPEDWQKVTIAVLTADHRIAPEADFHKTVKTALATAEQTGGLVTIGIRPDRPETGYGYIELAERHGDAWLASQFREKPDLETAQEYVDAGNFLWNSGMFFWTLDAFMREMRAAQPEVEAAITEMSKLMKSGNEPAATKRFEALPSVSIDYVLMEKASKVYVVEATFNWDDLGAWDSLRRSYLPDEQGNVVKGRARLLDSQNCVVYSEDEAIEICVLGLEGVVVVVTDDKVMVCPAERAQDVRRFSST